MSTKEVEVVFEEEGSDSDSMSELESYNDKEVEDAPKGDLLVTRRVLNAQVKRRRRRAT